MKNVLNVELDRLNNNWTTLIEDIDIREFAGRVAVGRLVNEAKRALTSPQFVVWMMDRADQLGSTELRYAGHLVKMLDKHNIAEEDYKYLPMACTARLASPKYEDVQAVVLNEVIEYGKTSDTRIRERMMEQLIAHHMNKDTNEPVWIDIKVHPDVADAVMTLLGDKATRIK